MEGKSVSKCNWGRDPHLGPYPGTRRTERRPAGCTCSTVMVSAKVGTRVVIDNAVCTGAILHLYMNKNETSEDVRRWFLRAIKDLWPVALGLIFLTVLRSFEQQLPLSEPPKLVEEWEYLYERSIGCVGVLKDWLVRALTGVFRRNASVLTLRDLQAHALSVPQCDKMLSEALEGEVRLLESTDQRDRLRTRLGLGPQENYREKSSSGATPQVAVEITSSRKRRRKPGQRQPRRDPIGLPTKSYATAINV